MEGGSAKIFGEPIKGRDKYLGGDCGLDGCVYAVPGSGKNVIRIDPTNLEWTNFGQIPTKGPHVESSLPANQFKWLRGARGSDGCIYGIPSNANSILKIDPQNNKIEMVGGPFPGCWKWHGGALSPIDGCIYGVPCNATCVLKINPNTNEISTICEGLLGANKWYGGLVGNDGCIYCMPFNENCVLKIDPRTQSVSRHGEDVIKTKGGYKWHGGVVAPDGCIYAMPSHANAVLKVTPGENVGVKIIGNLRTENSIPHLYKYKYGGGVVGSDGNVYGIPSDADYVIRINTQTEQVEEVGPAWPGLNKWQNGFLGRDGASYCIPCNADTVLRIFPLPSGEVEVSTIGGPFPGGKEKWEGGTVGPDGAMYCYPQQADYMLQINPGPPAQ